MAKQKKVEAVKNRYDVQGPRKCYHCDKVGHLKAACLRLNKTKQSADFVLSVHGGGYDRPTHWVLDIG